MTTEVINADDPAPEQSLAELMQATGRAAVVAAQVLAHAPAEQKERALREAAAAIRKRQSDLLIANRRDTDAAARKGMRGALLDRLTLTEVSIETMALGLETVAAFPDPIGTVLAEWTRPNGLRIQRVRVPLGVVGMIYESRPNVTADAGALCLKAGNAVILRGGSESQHSNRAIHACLLDGLLAAGLPTTSIQLVATTDRAAVGYMLSSMSAFIDVLVPRGGQSLVARVLQEARVPVIGHLEGNCHVYVDAAADLARRHPGARARQDRALAAVVERFPFGSGQFRFLEIADQLAPQFFAHDGLAEKSRPTAGMEKPSRRAACAAGKGQRGWKR